MNPSDVSFRYADQMQMFVDDDTRQSDVITTNVGLEADAGTGQPQITFKTANHEVSIIMSADDALTLADTLRLYAKANKRREREWEKQQAAAAESVF